MYDWVAEKFALICRHDQILRADGRYSRTSRSRDNSSGWTPVRLPSDAVTAMLKERFPRRRDPSHRATPSMLQRRTHLRRRRPFLESLFRERRTANRAPSFRGARGADQVAAPVLGAVVDRGARCRRRVLPPMCFGPIGVSIAPG